MILESLTHHEESCWTDKYRLNTVVPWKTTSRLHANPKRGASYQHPFFFFLLQSDTGRGWEQEQSWQQNKIMRKCLFMYWWRGKSWVLKGLDRQHVSQNCHPSQDQFVPPTHPLCFRAFGSKQGWGGCLSTPSHLLRPPLSVRELREPSEPW